MANFFDIVKSAEFFSAMSGALVGGAIGLTGQVLAFNEARKFRDADRLATNQALAHSLLFKFIRLYSNATTIAEHFQEKPANEDKSSVALAWHEFYLPLANKPDAIAFSSDEMALLLSVADVEIFNTAIDLDVRHNSLLAALCTLDVTANGLRDNLAEKATLDRQEGRTFSLSFGAADALQIKSKMAEVDHLCPQLDDMAQSLSQDAEKALFATLLVLQTKLKIKLKLEKFRK